MRASVKNYRQSPRKVRLVADFVCGKKVKEAVIELEYLPKRAAHIIRKLIESASANADHNFKVPSDNLYIKEIRVDKGITFKRYRPRARGVAKPIRKRTSNIVVALGVKENNHS